MSYLTGPLQAVCEAGDREALRRARARLREVNARAELVVAAWERLAAVDGAAARALAAELAGPALEPAPAPPEEAADEAAGDAAGWALVSKDPPTWAATLVDGARATLSLHRGDRGRYWQVRVDSEDRVGQSPREPTYHQALLWLRMDCELEPEAPLFAGAATLPEPEAP